MKEICMISERFYWKSIYGKCLILLLTFCLLIYYPAVFGNFFSDDFVYIVNNEFLKGIDFRHIFTIFTAFANKYEYLPIRDLSYWFDYSFFGVNPLAFHLHNLILYGLDCVSVCFFSIAVIRLIKAGKSFGNDECFLVFSITALFATHPAHVESVAWISGRKDLLSGLFAVLTLWQFVEILNEEFGKLWRYIGTLILFALALLSKSSVVPLPLVLFFLALVYFSKKHSNFPAFWRSFVVSAPFGVLSLSSVLTQVFVGGKTGVKLDPFSLLGGQPERYFILPFKILGYLAKITVAPFGLRLMYDLEVPGWKPSLLLFIGLVVAIVFIVAIYKFIQTKSLTAFGVIFFVCFCLPFLQLIPFRTWSFVSERFLFLPVLGLSIPVAILIAKIGNYKYVLLSIILLVLVVVHIDRIVDWSAPPKSLETSNIAYNKKNTIAILSFMSDVLFPEKKFNEARSLIFGLEDKLTKKVLTQYVNSQEVFYNKEFNQYKENIEKLKYFWDKTVYFPVFELIAKMYEEKGDEFNASRFYYKAYLSLDLSAKINLDNVEDKYKSIIDLYKVKINRNRNVVGNYLQLGGLYMEIFQIQKAQKIYSQALEIASGEETKKLINYNLGLCSYRSTDYGRAIKYFVIANQQGLNSTDLWNNLGLSYLYLGMTNEAEAAFLKAMSLNRFIADPAYNLGMMKAKLGEKESALKALTEAKERLMAKGQSTDLVDFKLEAVESLDN